MERCVCVPLPSVVAAAARYPAFGAQVPQTFMQSRDAPTGQSVCPARDSTMVRQSGAAAARCHDLSVGLPSAGFDDGAAAGYCSRAVPFLLPILPHEHERKPTKHLAPLLTSGKSSCTAATPEWATRDLCRGAVVVDVGRTLSLRKIIAVGSINIIPHCRPAFLNRRLKLYQVRTKYFGCSKLVEERVETPVG